MTSQRTWRRQGENLVSSFYQAFALSFSRNIQLTYNLRHRVSNRVFRVDHRNARFSRRLRLLSQHLVDMLKHCFYAIAIDDVVFAISVDLKTKTKTLKCASGPSREQDMCRDFQSLRRTRHVFPIGGRNDRYYSLRLPMARLSWPGLLG